ncbi:MAG: iron-containing alcohol dehydrogenase [Roseiflexaceae bacterium]|nr:iron-containing alcohol dehydrogenase [Roseiflexaceae bacterium]
MTRSEYSTAGRIILGAGTSNELPSLLGSLGQRIMLIGSAGSALRGGPPAALAARLIGLGVVIAQSETHGEPDIAIVEVAATLARDHGCDGVIAIGGGSVIDTAKAVAALAANPGSALEYMEVIGAGRTLEHPALPLIAVPTTAGAGSEVTRNAVVRSPTHRAKASIRDASLFPKIALVDPELTYGLPAHITASCGLDALTQLIEAFVSRRAGPLTDGLCCEGLALAARSLRNSVQQPDAQSRFDLSTAALLSGMALANAGLGAVHGIAAPLGGMFPAPHGAACAALLAPITKANLRALYRSDPNSPALARYAEIARLLGVTNGLQELPAMLKSLVGELGIPNLASYGLSEADISELATQAAQASSSRSNPVTLEHAELADAIAEALSGA